ncbi:dihydrolipoyl dehydrogenase family protein [Psychroserpens mesophilus]|uniref:dihydrolipoyl dehydrogenase family protein n=1 Tax=Psychroserpens mesophilus TaxID=325473 RepID=UPI003D64D357
MEIKHYNVFVIGSGIAGQTAAEICAKSGLTVALSDKREFGGTCAIRGCDPKKLMMQFTNLVHQSKQLKGRGVSELPEIKWKSVQKFKSKFTKPVPQATENDLNQLGINLYHQSPKFISESEVLVEGKTISADYFVIASGLVVRPLKMKGFELLQNSDDILNLKKIPKSAIFIGSGYVGMEFCYMLSTLGCKVTMIEKTHKALSQFDSYLVEKLVENLRKNGVDFIFEADPLSVEKLRKNYRVIYKRKGKTTSLKSRVVYNASGRVPAIELLELENADVMFDDSGVLVNDFMQSKSNPKVYACGDVSSKSLPLTPLSGLQGHIAGYNIVHGNKKEFQNQLVPSVVFTHPNLASVGFSEEEANKHYKSIKMYKGDASDWYNAKKENTDVYAYKILVNERTNRIVGAHLLAAKAIETINILSMAIKNAMTVDDFKNQIFTYPSYSNDLKSMLAEK